MTNYILTAWEIEQIVFGLRERTKELVRHNGEYADCVKLTRSLTQKFELTDTVLVEAPDDINATTE